MIEDDEIILQPNATPPTGPGAFNYNGTSYVMQDAAGNFDPRSGGSNLDDIVLDDDGRIVYVGDGLFVLRG